MATGVNAAIHPASPGHLPIFIPGADGSDPLMTVMAIFLVVSILATGILFLRLHTLPERIAHKSHKLQFEIVAVLGLLALFTHQHIFWVIGLFLALIDLPDIGGPIGRIARATETIAGIKPPVEDTQFSEQDPALVQEAEEAAAAVAEEKRLLEATRPHELPKSRRS